MADLNQLEDLVEHNQNYNEEQHEILHQEIDTERKLRIAGDDANNNYTKSVYTELTVTSSRITTESLDRANGDIFNLNQYAELKQSFTDEWGVLKTDMSDQSILFLNRYNQLVNSDTDLNSRITLVQSGLNSDLQDYKTANDAKYSSMDKRITKYEKMLSDITIDNAQITIDNGEITLGAWTILSQARQWDLDIIRNVKKYQTDTDTKIDDALNEFQDSLPNEEDIINKAIEELSNSPIIKELDSKLGESITSIDDLYGKLIEETKQRQAELLKQAQETTDQLNTRVTEIYEKTAEDNQAQALALAREAKIRAEQLALIASDLDTEVNERIDAIQDLSDALDKEAQDRAKAIQDAIAQINIDVDLQVEAINKTIADINKHVDDINTKLSADIQSLNTQVSTINASVTALRTDLNTNVNNLTKSINDETAARIAGIKDLNDGLTREIQLRKDGDTASIAALDNYKVSNDAAIANIQVKITGLVTDTSTLAQKTEALDVRLTTNEKDTKAAQELAADAVTKATTALTQNTALASRVTSVEASIKDINTSLGNKVETTAFNELKTQVTSINGVVTTHTSDITALKSSIVDLDKNTKLNTTAISELKTVQTQQGDKITQLVSSTTELNTQLESVKNDIKTKVDTSAFNALSTQVTQQGSLIDSNSSNITQLKNSVDTINGTLATKADASALTALTNRVTTAEGSITSMSSNITSLTATVNTKNRTYRQDAAPTANLVVGDIWINTTAGQNNKQSRWSGSAWVDLTDPRIASTATAVNNLSATVTQQGTSITSISQNLTNLTNTVETLNGKVDTKADASAVSQLSSQITTLDGVVSNQGTSITKLRNDLTTVENNVSKMATSEALAALESKVTQQGNTITSNSSDIVSLKNDLKTANDNIATKASQTALNNLDSKVTSQGNTITAQGNSITSLQGSITTINNTLNTKADVSAVNALTTRVTATETGLVNQATQITSLNAALSNIAVGSTNLLRNTATYGSDGTYKGLSVRKVIRAANATAYVDAYNANIANGITDGGFYVASFYARANKVQDVSCFFYSPDTTKSAESSTGQKTNNSNGQVPVTVTTDWKRYWIKWEAAASTTKNIVVGRLNTQDTEDRWLEISGLKLEKGTIATDWSPAPEDLATAAAVSSLTTTVTQQGNTITSQGSQITSLRNDLNTANATLTAKADQTALDSLKSTVTTQGNTITTQGSSITALQGNVATINTTLSTKADNSAVTALTTRVTAAETAITNQAGQITALTSSINNLKVGGVNILAKSRMALGSVEGTTGISSNSNTATHMRFASNYVIQAGSNRTFVATWENNHQVKVYPFVDSTFKGVITLTSGVPYTFASDVTSFNLEINNSAGTLNTIYTDKIQLERATKASEWSIPPEDLLDNQTATSSAIASLNTLTSQQGSTISSQADQITTLKNNITTINNSLNTKADNSALTALAARVTVTEGSISNQATQITNLNAGLSTVTSQVGITKSYTIRTQRGVNNTGKSNGLFNSNNVRLFSFSRGLHLFVFDASGNASFINRYDTYSTNLSAASQELDTALTALADGTYFGLVGCDHIGGFGTSTDQYVLAVKTQLINAGVTSAFLTKANNNFVPIIIARKGAATTSGVRNTGAVEIVLDSIWYEHNLSVVNGVPSGLNDNYFVSTQIDATASALSELSSTVTQQGNTITSQGSQITALQNSVSSINSTLSTKADSSAVSSLASRVTTAEGQIASQSNQLTSLNNSLVTTITKGYSQTRILSPSAFNPSSYTIDANRVGYSANDIPTTNIGTDSFYGSVFVNDSSVRYLKHKSYLSRKAGTTYRLWFTLKTSVAFNVNPILLAVNSNFGTSNIASLTKNITTLDTFITDYIDVTDNLTTLATTHPFCTAQILVPASSTGSVVVAKMWMEDITEQKALEAADANQQTQLTANASAITALTNTVTQQGSAITSNSNQITAINNNINSINSTLSTKADSSVVSGLSSRVTTAEGNITTQSGQITSLTNTLNNLAIGSTNLLTQSAGVFTPNRSLTDNYLRLPNTKVNLVNGKQYTISGETNGEWSNIHSAGTENNRATLWLIGSDKEAVVSTSTTGTTGTTLIWDRPTGTYTARVNGYKADNSVWFKNLKIESGNKRTDWSPAPEDIQTQITGNSTAITDLNSKVTQIGNTVTSQSNQLTQLQNDLTTVGTLVNTKADASTVTALANRVTATEGSLTTQSNQITSLNNSIKGLAASSGDLVPNPTFDPKYDQMGYTVIPSTNTEVPVGCPYPYVAKLTVRDHSPNTDAIAWKVGDIYEISALVASNESATAAFNLYIYRMVTPTSGASALANGGNQPVTQVWTRKTWRFSVQASWLVNGSTNYPFFKPFLQINQSSPFGSVWYVTDWHVKNITEAAKAQSTADANASAITTLDNKVTQIGNTVTSQSGQITTLQNNLSSLTTTVNNKADSSALSALGSRVTTVEGTVTSQSDQIIKLTNSVNSISVGGTNLLAQSKLLPGYFTTGTGVVAGPTAKDRYDPNYYDTSAGTVYCFTYYSNNGVTQTGSAARIVWYDADKNVLSLNQVQTTTYGTIKVTAPANAVFYRISTIAAGLKVKFEKGSLVTDWDPAPEDVQSQIDASATALSGLTNTVTQLGSTVSSQSTQITTLQNSVTSIQGTLNTKADNSALTSLAARVTATEGSITNQASQITSLTAQLTYSKTRANNLVYDGSFESLTTASGSMSPSSTARLGSTSLKFTRTQAANNGNNNDITWQDYFSIADNRRYYIEYWVRNDPDNTIAWNTGSRVTVGLQSNSARGANRWDGISFDPSTLTADWLKISGYVTILSGQTRARLWLSIPSLATNVQGASVLIDDVYIADVTEGINAVEGNAATASAVASLDSKVTQQGTTITSQSTQITNLSNSLNNLTTTVNSKADASALSTLSSKVTVLEGNLTTTSNSVTSLQSSLNNLAVGGTNLLSNTKDIGNAGTYLGFGYKRTTRNANATTYVDSYSISLANLSAGSYTLSYYARASKAQQVANFFYSPDNTQSAQSSTGQTSSGGNGQVNLSLTTEWKRYWIKWVIPADTASKGMVVARLNETDTEARWVDIAALKLEKGNVATDWSPSPSDVSIDTSQFASASALTALDTKVTNVDNRVTSQATLLTQIESKANANSAAIQVQGNVLNGIKAEYTIKLDVNGLVAGIGLINDGNKTAIGINADFFYVGKPTDGKKPFMVLTSSQTINGVTYPAGTWIDVALIANATIGTAKIADAAITNAKIADLAVTNAKILNLSAEKITAGIISADRIGAGSITTDKINAAAIDAISVSARNFTSTSPDGAVVIQTGAKREVYAPNGTLVMRDGWW